MTEIKNPGIPFTIYGLEVLLNLSRYQPALGNERINTITNTYKEYTYVS